MAIGEQSSNLPTIQRFDAGDYPKSDAEFQAFLSTLNLFTQPVWNILNRSVDIMQNTKEEIYSFNITAGATYEDNTFDFTPRKFGGRPNGVILGQVQVLGATVTPVGSPVTFDWIYSGNQVKIIAIYGLTPDVSYSFTVRIF